MMLHAKYESSSPYCLGQEDFYKRAMMALDRSPESFSPQMNSTSLFLWFPTCDPWGGDSFDSNGHHVNKIDKGLQGDATYRKYKLYPFQFEKNNFEVGFHCFYVPNCDPRGGISFDPKGII